MVGSGPSILPVKVERHTAGPSESTDIYFRVKKLFENFNLLKGTVSYALLSVSTTKKNNIDQQKQNHRRQKPTPPATVE